jgi:hypothetical protein
MSIYRSAMVLAVSFPLIVTVGCLHHLNTQVISVNQNLSSNNVLVPGDTVAWRVADGHSKPFCVTPEAALCVETGPFLVSENKPAKCTIKEHRELDGGERLAFYALSTPSGAGGPEACPAMTSHIEKSIVHAAVENADPRPDAAPRLSTGPLPRLTPLLVKGCIGCQRIITTTPALGAGPSPGAASSDFDFQLDCNSKHELTVSGVNSVTAGSQLTWLIYNPRKVADWKIDFTDKSFCNPSSLAADHNYCVVTQSSPGTYRYKATLFDTGGRQLCDGESTLTINAPPQQ